MKIRVIPDIHGHSWWKDLVTDIDELDHVIFLGDYEDDWDLKDEEIVSNFWDVIKFKEDYMDKVTLLYGNHSFNYISPFIGYCSGFRRTYFHEINEIYEQKKSLFKICKLIKISLPLYSIPEQKLLFSHAGFSTSWVRYHYRSLNKKHFEEFPNDNEDELKFFNVDDVENFDLDYKTLDMLLEIGYYRGGNNLYGGPVWADYRETDLDYLLGYHQFVGHTPLKHMVIQKRNERHPENSSITFCDLGSKKNKITIESNDKNLKVITDSCTTVLC